MMTEAARKAALLDVTFMFLDKEYKDDTYATDPFGNQYRTGCYRSKVTSGFRFRMDQPQFTLTIRVLTIVQNISKINGHWYYRDKPERSEGHLHFPPDDQLQPERWRLHNWLEPGYGRRPCDDR